MASGAGEKTKLLDWTEATAGGKDDQTCTAWQLSANGQTTSFGLEVPQVFIKKVTRNDKKSDEGSNSVRMRPENSGASKVVQK